MGEEGTLKTWKILLLCFLAVLSGIGLTFLYLSLNEIRVPTKWFVFDSVKETRPNGNWGEIIGSTSEALFDSDILLPEIKRIELKGKFKEVADIPGSRIMLGYILNITVDKLDKKYIPKKYLESKEEKNKSGVWTIPPLEEVTYAITFVIVFKDNDGFEIFRTDPIEERVRSGATNYFQNLAPDLIPHELFIKAKQIEPRITVVKCLSCRAD